jgi:hypothetical protein
MPRHASPNDRHHAMNSTERSFGLVFAFVFSLVGVWPMRVGAPPRPWALALAALFLTTGLLRPALLAPMNAAWFRLGVILHSIVNPVIMAVIYYGGVVPTGVALKLLGKDVLRLKRDRSAGSYWIVRQPPGPAPSSMRKQF